MPVLNLDLIVDEGKTGILCSSEGQIAALISELKLQRPDIDVSAWDRNNHKYVGDVFFLNYAGAKCLQRGSMSTVKNLGLGFIPFEELIQQDLPDINANETGILSLLGFE